MRITISGLPGSGTTTLARTLSHELSIPLISAGEVFRQMAAEKGMTLAEFGRYCEEDPAVDMMVDERQREIGLQSDDIIIEGRLSGWKVPEADVRIWLKAPLEIRVRRIFERDETTDLAQALLETKAREASEEKRYRQYYGIDISDLSLYDLVLDSSRFTPDLLARIVVSAIPSSP